MLQDRVYSFIKRNRLTQPGDRVLLAVSGGPDSSVLMYIMSGLSRALNISLVVAHLDHGLRSRESEQDALHVAEAAAGLGLPFSIGGRDVETYRQEHRLSLEEAAREVRYRFLFEVAAEASAGVIATGHTQNDNIETILMHLIRGSGTLGLKGLPVASQRQHQGNRFTIIRPLLDIKRSEIEEYCRERGIETRQDSTNLSLYPLRNRVRMELLPVMESYNPRAGEALLRLAAIASEELDYLAAERDRVWPDVITQQAGTFVVDKAGFKALHTALQRSILRRALNELSGSLKDFEAGHIEDVLSHLDKPAGKQALLPGGISFTVEYSRYLLGKDPAELCPLPELPGPARLNLPGSTQAGRWQISAKVIQGCTVPPDCGEFTACFDFEKTGAELVMRPRQPGDRFMPLGLRAEKKVKDYLIDARVPRSWRDRIPVIESAGHIIWLAGHRIDERVKVTPDTRQMLIIKISW